MKSFKLEGEPREDLGKKASKELRKQGLIPAVLYGQKPVELPYQGKLNKGEKLVEIGNSKGVIVTDFTVSFDGIRKLIYTPEIYLVEIDIKGNRVIKAILKDSQYHPVSDAILHADFLEVFDNIPIMMEVPVVLRGHAIGVRSGGKLNQSLRKLKVKGLANNIPEILEVNVDKLQLGKVIKVGELSYPDIELISPKNAVVCSVKTTRAAQGTTAGAVEEETPEETEGEEGKSE
ncbi:MAG: 50S ribosomal protein L25/general stress protein Ctc [Tannerella sp.]|jgi:large subunit ribosomal protein L25|nr:50S ribosomal protein L25/general stress protein Ctc [Tannerella sp.]